MLLLPVLTRAAGAAHLTSAPARVAALGSRDRKQHALDAFSAPAAFSALAALLTAPLDADGSAGTTGGSALHAASQGTPPLARPLQPPTQQRHDDQETSRLIELLRQGLPAAPAEADVIRAAALALERASLAAASAAVSPAVAARRRQLAAIVVETATQPWPAVPPSVSPSASAAASAAAAASSGGIFGFGGRGSKQPEQPLATAFSTADAGACVSFLRAAAALAGIDLDADSAANVEPPASQTHPAAVAPRLRHATPSALATGDGAGTTGDARRLGSLVTGRLSRAAFDASLQSSAGVPPPAFVEDDDATPPAFATSATMAPAAPPAAFADPFGLASAGGSGGQHAAAPVAHARTTSLPASSMLAHAVTATGAGMVTQVAVVGLDEFDVPVPPRGATLSAPPLVPPHAAAPSDDLLALGFASPPQPAAPPAPAPVAAPQRVPARSYNPFDDPDDEAAAPAPVADAPAAPPAPAPVVEEEIDLLGLGAPLPVPLAPAAQPPVGVSADVTAAPPAVALGSLLDLSTPVKAPPPPRAPLSDFEGLSFNQTAGASVGAALQARPALVPSPALLSRRDSRGTAGSFHLPAGVSEESGGGGGAGSVAGSRRSSTSYGRRPPHGPVVSAGTPTGPLRRSSSISSSSGIPLPLDGFAPGIGGSRRSLESPQHFSARDRAGSTASNGTVGSTSLPPPALRMMPSLRGGLSTVIETPTGTGGGGSGDATDSSWLSRAPDGRRRRSSSHHDLPWSRAPHGADGGAASASATALGSRASVRPATSAIGGGTITAPAWALPVGVPLPPRFVFTPVPRPPSVPADGALVLSSPHLSALTGTAVADHRARCYAVLVSALADGRWRVSLEAARLLLAGGVDRLMQAQPPVPAAAAAAGPRALPPLHAPLGREKGAILPTLLSSSPSATVGGSDGAPATSAAQVRAAARRGARVFADVCRSVASALHAAVAAVAATSPADRPVPSAVVASTPQLHTALKAALLLGAAFTQYEVATLPRLRKATAAAAAAARAAAMTASGGGSGSADTAAAAPVGSPARPPPSGPHVRECAAYAAACRAVTGVVDAVVRLALLLRCLAEGGGAHTTDAETAVYTSLMSTAVTAANWCTPSLALAMGSAPSGVHVDAEAASVSVITALLGVAPPPPVPTKLPAATVAPAVPAAPALPPGADPFALPFAPPQASPASGPAAATAAAATAPATLLQCVLSRRDAALLRAARGAVLALLADVPLLLPPPASAATDLPALKAQQLSAPHGSVTRVFESLADRVALYRHAGGPVLALLPAVPLLWCRRAAGDAADALLGGALSATQRPLASVLRPAPLATLGGAATPGGRFLRAVTRGRASGSAGAVGGSASVTVLAPFSGVSPAPATLTTAFYAGLACWSWDLLRALGAAAAAPHLHLPPAQPAGEAFALPVSIAAAPLPSLHAADDGDDPLGLKALVAAAPPRPPPQVFAPLVASIAQPAVRTLPPALGVAAQLLQLQSAAAAGLAAPAVPPVLSAPFDGIALQLAVQRLYIRLLLAQAAAAAAIQRAAARAKAAAMPPRLADGGLFGVLSSAPRALSQAAPQQPPTLMPTAVAAGCRYLGATSGAMPPAAHARRLAAWYARAYPAHLLASSGGTDSGDAFSLPLPLPAAPLLPPGGGGAGGSGLGALLLDPAPGHRDHHHDLLGYRRPKRARFDDALLAAGSLASEAMAATAAVRA